MDIQKERVIDLLDQQEGPALSSTSDMPVVETKPDSQAAAPAETEAKPAEVKDEAEQPAESATAATETEQTGEPAKKESRGVQKALDRLTAERETEKRRADQETEARIRLEERLRLLEESKPKPSDDDPVRPSKTDYPDADAWDAALMAYADEKAAHTARKEVQAFEARSKQEAEKKSIEDGQRVVREAYNERVTKARKKYPDFKEVAENPDVQVSMPVVHAIIHSERGPDLQYYLGSNPDEAARINALAPPLQLVELGLLVAKIDQPAAKPVSAAPAPIKPTRPGTEASQKDPEKMSMEEYAAWRKAEDKGRGLRH